MIGTAASCTGGIYCDSPRHRWTPNWPWVLSDVCAPPRRKQLQASKGEACRKLSGCCLPLGLREQRSPSFSWWNDAVCRQSPSQAPFIVDSCPLMTPWLLKASEQPLWSSEHITGAGKKKMFIQGHCPFYRPALWKCSNPLTAKTWHKTQPKCLKRTGLFILKWQRIQCFANVRSYSTVTHMWCHNCL